MTYEYRPLADAGAEIRLVVLGPGAFNDQINITFKVQPLHTRERPLRYRDDDLVWDALSYAWGSDKNASAVEIGCTGGAYLPITHNLMLHYGTFVTKIESVLSGSMQYLGPEQDSSKEAIAILRQIGNSVVVNWYSEFMTPAISCSESDKHFADRDTVLPYRNGALVPVLQLFERDYFKRVWIRQEVALATRATIHCAHDQLDSVAFKTTVACLVYKGFYYSALLHRQFSEWDYLRTLVYFIFTLRPATCSYTVLDRYLGNAECRDDRDRIYAMLSLMRESDASIGIRPDYSLTTQELYSKAAVGAIELHQSLVLLENCRLATRTLNILNWVPDWTVPWQDSNMSTGWSACAWISPSISVLDAKRIRVAGVSVSRIAAIVRADIGEIKDETERCDAIVDIIRNVESCSRKQEAKPLPERIWVDVFCLTATNRRHAEAYDPQQTTFPTFQQYIDVIEAICFFPERLTDSKIRFKEVLVQLAIAWHNLDFFLTTDGFIGLANPGIKEGDQISILLGNRFPVVLRSQVHTIPHEPKSWQVVGMAIVGTLMMGEIFYSCADLSRLQRVHRTYGPHDASQSINGYAVAIKDHQAKQLITDPAQFLAKMGIKIEFYQKHAPRLVVREETFRATSIDLRNFILV
ncbi:hypothetical protein COCVIDRAFT_20664 [Bipolaris victoriae FI3]|uniref:Heterokaryon incompatibility domain-containing protein n=1 Tax=Bipolaris victoriae (strain FI3) TaxID=930091 RepID=W7DZ70_BIPV3|nr:hypothetical protein COCVIDRAFT_20664 [Bipolaris victoriae FI3]